MKKVRSKQSRRTRSGDEFQREGRGGPHQQIKKEVLEPGAPNQASF